MGLPVWGTPANFSGFRVLPSLLQRRRSPQANQTLHDAWPSSALVHYNIHFGSFCPLTEFCPVQNSLYVQVLRSPILAALLHGTPAAGISQTLRRGIQGMELRNFHRGRHLYLAGRPSLWTSVHILVRFVLCSIVCIVRSAMHTHMNMNRPNSSLHWVFLGPISLCLD